MNLKKLSANRGGRALRERHIGGNAGGWICGGEPICLFTNCFPTANFQVLRMIAYGKDRERSRDELFLA